MNTKKIFLTTIAELRSRGQVDYFVCDKDVEYGTYTTAMSIAEAGIKYIISKFDIDEIVVLGGKHSADKKEKDKMKISDMHIENMEAIDTMSEYGFLCYRISEFLNQLDFEYADIAELIKEDSKEKIKNIIQDFKNENNITGDREIFYKLSVEKDLSRLFYKELLKNSTSDERKWIQHYLYSQMDSYYKMHIKDYNVNATIRFIDINDKDLLTINDITTIVNEVLNESNKGIELYIDSQGLTPTDGNMLLSTFLMANRKIGYNCEIKGIINTKHAKKAFAGRIVDAYTSYNAQKLVEAIDLFLDYGKDTALKDCWDTLGFKNSTIDTLFAAMDCIDEGIALCNIDLIIYGMKFIKKVTDEYMAKGQIDNIYTDYIINAIRSDYGELLDKEDVYIYELLKWMLKKGLYQQILTLIESKLPTDMIERGIYYYAKNEKDIDEYLKSLNVLYWSEQIKMRWGFNDIAHYFIKYYGRAAVDNKQARDAVSKDFARLKVDLLKGPKNDVMKAYSELNNDDLLYDLFYGYFNLGNIRNQVNHAGVLEKELSEKALATRKDFRKEIKTELEKFVDLYERVCTSVKNKVKPLTITTQKLRWYARNHELKLLDTSTNDLVKQNTYSCLFNGKEVKIDITLFDNEEFYDDAE